MDLAYSCSSIASKRLSRGVMGMVLAAHAGVLFALATHSQEILIPDEQPIAVSLIAESPPMPDIAPKPLPVQLKPSRPVKNTVKPQAVVAPKEPEPQLVAQAAESAAITAPEQKQLAPEAQSLPPQEAAKAVEAPAKDEPVEQPKLNADYLDNPAPAYPSLSRKLREEGRVLLRVRVDVGGNPEQVTLHESSGFSRLDERAAETVRRWQFVPARQGGRPVVAWVIVPIQFSLKGK